MILLCLTTEVEITYFTTSLQLHFFAAADFFRRLESFHSTNGGGSCHFWSATNIKIDDTSWLIFEKKWIPCLSALNGCRWWVGSSFGVVRDFCYSFGTVWMSRGFFMGDLFEAYLVVLFSAHRFHTWPFFTFGVHMDSLALATSSSSNPNFNRSCER